jgi:predicted ATPase
MQNNAANSSKRHQGPQKAIGLCQLSCEYLRLIGIVSPICQLIFNMLDVIYGDFGGNECYSTMAEVVFDLKLMIDKPSKFLCGLDMDSTSLASQLNEMQIPRDQELQTILSCHRKCLEGSCEIAIIQGESGSGKSWVSQNVRRIVTSMGGIFLTGKFNYQMNQVKPFSALASAFDQYCDLILETNWVKLIAIQLQTALGQDACHLINVIPKLGLVIEDDAHHTASVLDIDCKNSIQRLHHLFCQFLEVIATNAQISLTLCLDDIQWADEASIAVLTRLLMQQNGKFFFLGCCRGDEMESDHSFWKMLEAVNIAPRGVTTIQLKGIGDEVLNGVVSDLLSLSPRLVRPLSRIIHSKTRGNILFFSQLMLSLHREGLIYLDFSKERWTWNEEKILSMKLPENVAICFTNGINKLPNDLQSALHTLSLFGASARVEYLELLESQLGLNLAEPLTRAAAEGLVIKQGGHYHFCHDCIQEASYKMTCGKFRGSNHLMYGKCLVKHAAEKIDDGMLFTAVNQINLAGPSVISETGEYHTIANYNLIVGKKAMAMSAFASAYSFFKHGIAILLLEKNHWELHYKFSIEIFELAMKSSLAAGRLCGVEIYSNQLLKHAKCFADTLNTHFIVMLSLSYSSTLKAVEKGIDIVSKLGEEMTIHPSTEVLDYHIKHTQLLIRGVSEEQLLNHRMMTNSNKLAIMKFLARLQSYVHSFLVFLSPLCEAYNYHSHCLSFQRIAFVIKPEVHKLVIMKMVQLTMTDGLSSHSAFGFASFGSFLSKLGNLNAGECYSCDLDSFYILLPLP